MPSGIKYRLLPPNIIPTVSGTTSFLFGVSKSEAKRLVEQGGVKIDNEVVKEDKIIEDISKKRLIQVGKRRFYWFEKNNKTPLCEGLLLFVFSCFYMASPLVLSLVLVVSASSAGALRAGTAPPSVPPSTGSSSKTFLIIPWFPKFLALGTVIFRLSDCKYNRAGIIATSGFYVYPK